MKWFSYDLLMSLSSLVESSNETVSFLSLVFHFPFHNRFFFENVVSLTYSKPLSNITII